jgi:hypothetical protein
MSQDEEKKDLYQANKTAATTPTAPATTPSAEKPKNQMARVLGGFQLDGVDYQPNDVIEASSDLIRSLGSSVDSDPAAVARATKSEGAVVKKHPAK